jgi:hypothetical protein
MAQDTFNIKEGDFLPVLQRTLYDENDAAVDLTNATSVKFTMKRGATTKISKVGCAIIDTLNGIVQYAWTGTDTDTPGVYDAEFQVTYVSAKIETFPNDGYIKITITPELA